MASFAGRPSTAQASRDDAVLLTWWQSIALLEHASIASFARFTLELMAIGAPADLIADAIAAGADEVAHTRLALAAVARYGGGDVEIGPMDLHDVKPACSLEAVALGLVREACVGETLGAAEAALSAHVSRDDFARDTWARIATDEAKHAALAWRVLSWIVPRLDDEARARVREALAAELTRVRPYPLTEAAGHPHHGLLSATAREGLHAQLIQQTLRPCAAALGLA